MVQKSRTIIFLLFALLSLFLGKSAWANDIAFPAFTSLIVDESGVLSSSVKSDLEKQLVAYQKRYGNQLAVAIVPDLQGMDIEGYANRLARHWGVGKKGEDNGVLLLFAMQERKVRIEVGYGLEGVLTDARSSQIINQIIVPRIKQGQFEIGVVAGIVAIIHTMSPQLKNLDSSGKRVEPNSSDGYAGYVQLGFLFYVLLGILFWRSPRGGMWWMLLFMLFGGGRGRGSFGGGSVFSGGGGGSFGGGGASGSW